MKHDEIIGFVGTGVSTALTISQANETFQTVQIVLSCICFVVTIAYTVYKWYKKATSKESPGGEKVTKEEINELFNNLADNLKKEEEKEND